MRPRVFPAEDLAQALTAWLTYQRFNEAAGIPRGRLGALKGRFQGWLGFNEAAGIPRGRHRRDILLGDVRRLQ